jgi:hypothetical protein
MRGKGTLFHGRTLKPSTGDFSTIYLNDSHLIRGVGNQIDDVTNAELHHALLIYSAMVPPAR